MEPTISYDASRDRAIIRYANGVEAEIQFQNGPIGDDGENGIQNEDLLNVLAVRLRVLQSRLPCRENEIALAEIETARMWLEERNRLRRLHGVEGTMQRHGAGHVAVAVGVCGVAGCEGLGMTMPEHEDKMRRLGRLGAAVHA